MPPKGSEVDHRNAEALDGSPATEAGKPRRLAMNRRGRGASHVVRARESRVHGEGRQEVGTHPKSEERSVDADQQADKAWLLDVQRKLYQWSRDNPGEVYRKLWNWVTDPRNLRCAWRHVASNKGKRSAGIDGMTVARIRREQGEATFVNGLREELRSSSYRPSPCRRKLIPKRGKPGKLRPLAIPTVADRVVQGAAKQILEPIFEAQFWAVSYGFRPGRDCHGALEHLRLAATPRAKDADGKCRQAPYSWIIEGDIRDCLETSSHYTPSVDQASKRLGRPSETLIRKPLRRPRETWTA